MHTKAKAWNLKRYPKLDGSTPKGVILFDAPCDWCGEPVDIGHIHKEPCLREEAVFWLDIFN